MAFSEKNILNIMSCDGYICADSKTISKEEIEKDLNDAVLYLYGFEQKFSRFITNNELFNLNQANGENFKVSNELFEMLELSKEFFELTNGIFNISILETLLNEGYTKSKHLGFTDNAEDTHKDEIVTPNISQLKLNKITQSISKPENLKIDLGGIGKSYAINKIAGDFDRKYDNFCISLGGDMKLKGKDTKNKYDYWAIEVENPVEPKLCVATLIVNNTAIATSGVNRRTWKKGGEIKNHIIDPRNNKSVSNDLLSVSVIDDNIINADVLAKTILVLGKDAGAKYSEDKNIAALLIDKKLNLVFSSKIKSYVWQEK